VERKVKGVRWPYADERHQGSPYNNPSFKGAKFPPLNLP